MLMLRTVCHTSEHPYQALVFSCLSPELYHEAPTRLDPTHQEHLQHWVSALATVSHRQPQLFRQTSVSRLGLAAEHNRHSARNPGHHSHDQNLRYDAPRRLLLVQAATNMEELHHNHSALPVRRHRSLDKVSEAQETHLATHQRNLPSHQKVTSRLAWDRLEVSRGATRHLAGP